MQTKQESKQVLATDPPGVLGLAYTLMFIWIVWTLFGLIAFVTSIVCFDASFTGTASDKWLGFVLALVFGPLYFIYIAFQKSYCRKKTSGMFGS